jgi:hypothetical protein
VGYQPTTRNYTGIQLENIRKTLDATFNQEHDELSTAYYDYWAKGLSWPWKGFDVQATPKASKVLFEKLHGLIFSRYLVALHNANMALLEPARYSENEYRYIRNEKGDIIADRVVEAQAAINLLAAEGISIEEA